MTLAELVDTCNRTGIRLGVDGDRLRVDAAKGTLTPDIRDALVEYRPVLIDALAPAAIDAESEAIRRADRHDDVGPIPLEPASAELAGMTRAEPLGYADVSIESIMEDWLWLVTTMDDDTIIIGTDGRRQSVYHTARQLLHGIGLPVADRWGAILHLYDATLRVRPNYPTATDAFHYYHTAPPMDAEQGEFDKLLIEFADGMERRNQADVDAAWERINEINVRTRRAGASPTPSVGGIANVSRRVGKPHGPTSFTRARVFRGGFPRSHGVRG